MFKAAKRLGSSRRVEDSSWDADSMKYYKVWPSDEDRGRYVAEPGIDRKASAYIDRIRAKTTDHGLLSAKKEIVSRLGSTSPAMDKDEVELTEDSVDEDNQ
ncbi:hypothetical protein C3L33_21379, partial [Rhododendron williamsianum]